MNEIDDIKSRIKNRRYQEQKTNNKKEKGLFINKFLTFVVLMFALIITKKWVDSEYIQVPAFFKYFKKFVPYSELFNINILPINSSNDYVLISNNYYQGSSDGVYSYMSGYVAYSDNEQVVIKYDNEVYITYASLSSVLVNEYDRVDQNTLIGNYQDSFYMQIKYEDAIIDYETALSISQD